MGQTCYVNIAMVTFNRIGFTSQAIQSLREHTAAGYVLTVVDNASTDGTQEFLRKLEREGAIHNLILLERNIGVARAANLAWAQEPEAPFYLKLDNDIQIQKQGWLNKMLEVIQTLPEVGVVGYSFESESYPATELRGTPVRVKQQGHIGGACFLIPKRTENVLGKWCESYGLYGFEDMDYCFRVALTGSVNAYMEDEEIGLHLPGGRVPVIDGTYRGTERAAVPADVEYQNFKTKEIRRTVSAGIPRRQFEGYQKQTVPLRQASVFDGLRKGASWSEVERRTVVQMSDELRVDVGCGDTKPAGFVGVDICAGPDVDIVADLTGRFPFEDHSVSHLRAFDAIEHWPDRLHTMNEIWRVCKPGATVEIRVPSTDGRAAFQDPTHVSYWNINSFCYYSPDHPDFYRLCRKYGFHGAFAIRSLKNVESTGDIVHVHTILEALPLPENATRPRHVSDAVPCEPPVGAVEARHGLRHESSVEDEHQAALRLVNEGRQDEALAALRRIVGEHPDFQLAHNDLGVLCFQCDLRDEALRHLRESVRLVPHHLNSIRNLADVLIALGKDEEALTVLKRLVELAPDDPSAQRLLTQLEQKRELCKDGTNVKRPDASDPASQEGLSLRDPTPRDSTSNSSRDESTSWSGKRVMVYTDLPGIYGVGQYNHALLCDLAQRGAQAFCVQTEDDNPLVREREKLGVEHIWLSYHTRREFERTFTDTKDPNKVFKKHQPDLIVFSNCSPRSNLAAKRVAMQRGIPFVIAESYVPVELIALPQWTRECDTQLATQYRSARQVIAVSQDNLKLLREQYGMPSDRGVVIHYGRPTAFFGPRDEEARGRLRKEFAIPEEAMLCLTAARLDPVKGYQYQLRALAKLKESDVWPKLYFAWAGAGPAEEDIREGVRRLGVADHVRILGERHDIIDWLSAADCFVLTSKAEGMPICVMEAMAKGLPVAATAVSGTPEELGETGCLLPDPNAAPADQVAGALVQMLEGWARDPAQRRTAGERCHARAKEMFRVERMLTETLAVLQVGSPPRQGTP